jgi:hypothetical protein
MKQIILKTYPKMRHKMYRLMPRCVQQIGCMSMMSRARHITRSTKTLIILPSCSVNKFTTLYKNEITGMANI